MASWAADRPGTLLIARWGDEAYTVEERHLVRGMARLLELSLTMVGALRTERRLRQQADQQAAENARLLEEVREQQHLLVQLSLIQRAISRREPLARILGTVIAAASELIGDEIVGLWIADPQVPDRARLRASAGLDAEGQPGMPLDQVGTVGAAMRRDELVVVYGQQPVPARVTGGHGALLQAAMAAPVHEDGRVAGGLLVATTRPGRRYSAREQDTLRSFAQNVSLALTDAHTFERMNRAAHDTLTGLAGRGLFMDELTGQLVRSGRAAVLFVDLDRVKAVNDTYGHPAGDELLTRTAQRIRALIRPDDLAGRIGGDEFAVMLRGVDDRRTAAEVAERIVRDLAWPMRVAGHEVRVGASVGVALAGGAVDRLLSGAGGGLGDGDGLGDRGGLGDGAGLGTAARPRRRKGWDRPPPTTCCAGRISRCTRPNATAAGAMRCTGRSWRRGSRRPSRSADHVGQAGQAGQAGRVGQAAPQADAGPRPGAVRGAAACHRSGALG